VDIKTKPGTSEPATPVGLEDRIAEYLGDQEAIAAAINSVANQATKK